MAKSTILDDIHDNVSSRLDEVQTSQANHRKNCVALHKLHAQAAKVVRGQKLAGEHAFEEEMIQMIGRVLVVKKGPTADRVVRFVGAYTKHLNAKVAEESAKNGTTSDDTMASRFTSRLLNWLLQGFTAKNKVVRGRCVQMVSEMMAGIGDLDEDTYNLLRFSLTQRIHDKESFIRVHAVAALSKLIGSEDPDELEEDEHTALEYIMEASSSDPAAEVRRAALTNLPVTPDVIPLIIKRTRDTDALTRKLVYSAVLQPKLGHPRQLSIAQREDVVKTGLGDREPSVRVAVSKMLAGWLDVVMGEATPMKEVETWEGDDGGVMKGLVQFLCLFDVVGPGVTMAVDAILSIFNLRPDLTEVFKFTDDYWKSLIPESAVLSRIFVEYCLANNMQERLDDAGLPVVSAFAFHIQEHYNELLVIINDLDMLAQGEEDGESEEMEQREEDLDKSQSILKELLRVTLSMDFADELGRRKLFAVVRNLLGHPGLRDTLIEPALDVLRQITPSEQELIRIVVEIVQDLRDDGDENDLENDANRSDAGSIITASRRDISVRRAKEKTTTSLQEQKEADEKDLRALSLCIGMLERVNGTFEDNVTLEGLLADLIIPAVKRKELIMREKGLVSLGLCCLIAKNMALNSFQLFLGQLQSAPEELRLKVLQIVFDVVIMYEYDILGRSEEVAQQIITFLVQMLEAEEAPPVQAVLCIGICKLLLAGLIKDKKVLTSLLLIYISPATADNQELRQCLTYFFPVYCYSSLENQARMQAIFLQAFEHAAELREDLDEDQEMISLQNFSMLMAEWLDQEKSVDRHRENASQEKQVHAQLAVDLLRAMYDSERTDEERKVFCQLLNQLHINKGLDLKSVAKLSILSEHLNSQNSLNNATLERSVTKFRGNMSNMFEDDLQELEFNTLLDDEIRELYNYIGVDLPEGEVSLSFDGSSRADTTHAPDRDDSTPAPQAQAQPPARAARGRKKTRRDSDAEDNFVAADVSPMKPSTKRRVRETPRGVSPLRKKRNSRAQTVPVPQSQRRSTRQTRTPKAKTYVETDSEEELDEVPEEDEGEQSKGSTPREQSVDLALAESEGEIEEELIPSDSD